ncbi:Phosphotransferase enzyme family protein [Rubripirellula amarantea]|uniref:Phosphotransferase enzyme family protein n=1 Tax=Rubripirellula amarantea TaxID=2527999 RepID=A0A5C5WFW9_9BACT|nr:phosphotransferase [Rubripirellula amarantea]TWT49756.1 Phosphotransferase enzyme family protein [Rubripirellula amarantea]
MLAPESAKIVLAATDAKQIRSEEPIQSLWSGYGKIVRVHLKGGSVGTAIVKQVQTVHPGSQPRGWNTDLSHQRKLRSYQVEACWYRDWSSRLGNEARVANVFSIDSTADGHLFVLEDLDAAGFSQRHTSLDDRSVRDGLTWLANFHARFINASPQGLWPEGTYWHLATRPDELKAIEVSHPLFQHAHAIDTRLRDTSYPTLVHGDAKVANFCFADPQNDPPLAAVDFQYVGGGCGMKDVAYFLGSCLREEECQDRAAEMVDHYLDRLDLACRSFHPEIDTIKLVDEYRAMYPLAWADFHRFLLGWCPSHGKLHRYSQEMTELAIANL